MPERNLVNITITRKQLKQFALDKEISVSALIRLWLKEHKKWEDED